MLEFREDAPIGALIFWSVALVIWIVIRIRSRHQDRKDLFRKGKKENRE
jgi:hypothetical protein